MKITKDNIEVQMDSPSGQINENDEIVTISQFDNEGVADPERLYLTVKELKDLWMITRMFRDAGYLKFIS